MKQIKGTKMIKQRNYVQEYSLLINHSTVFKDRKRAFKNGERKHKKRFDLNELTRWRIDHSSTLSTFLT
jgi:hypothetical protein